jgi:putative ABC transport system permease protein
MRSFVALLRVDPGYETSKLLSMQVSVAGTAREPVPRRAEFFRELIQRTSQVSGVAAVSAINHVPLNGDDWRFPFAIEGRPPQPGGGGMKAAFLVVQPGYFRTMEIQLAEGREISRDEFAAAEHVVVINESMARHHWPNGSAIGQRISVDDPAKGADWFRIVGVVRDVRQSSWTQRNADQMYFPYVHEPRRAEREMSLASFLHPRYMTLVVRTSIDPAAMTRTVQRLVHDMEPQAPVSSPVTMEQSIARQFATPRF